MTIYQFSRADKNIIKKQFSFTGYLIFISTLFLLSVLHVLNIPSFFDGEFHLFLFEVGLFYMLIVRQYKMHALTILGFFAALDIVEGAMLGSSFISFLAGYGVVKFILMASPSVIKGLTPIIFTLLFFTLLTISIALKLFMMYFLQDFTITYDIFKLSFKNLSYNTLLCLNFAYVFKKYL